MTRLEKMEGETLGDKKGEVKVKALRPNSFSKTVGHVEVERLDNTLDYSLAKVEVKKPGDTLCDVLAEAP